MSSWQLVIGGVDYSSFCQWDSVSISQTIVHAGASMSLEVTIAGKYVPRPKAFQEIQFGYLSASTKLFGGIILTVAQTAIAPTVMVYRLQCIDYTKWLDHFAIPAGYVYGGTGPYAAGSPSTGTADAIVIDMITKWVTTPVKLAEYTGAPAPPATPIGPSVPITATSSATSATGRVYPSQVQVMAYVPDWTPVSQAISAIAQMADAVWFIDPDKVFWFADVNAMRRYGVLQAPLTTRSVTFFDQTFDGTVIAGWQPAVTEGPIYLPVLDADDPYAGVPVAVATANPRRTAYRKLVITEDCSSTISGAHLFGFEEVSDSYVIESPRMTDRPKKATTPNLRMRGDGVTRFFALSNKPVSPEYTSVFIRDQETVTPAFGDPANKTYTTVLKNLKTEYVDGTPADPSGITVMGFMSNATASSNTIPTGMTVGADVWKGMSIYLTGNQGAGQLRVITGNTTAGLITVSPAWTINPAYAALPNLPTAFAIFVTGLDLAFICTSNQGVRFTIPPAKDQDVDVWYRYYVPGSSQGVNLPLAAEIAKREGFGAGLYFTHIQNAAYSTPIALNDGTPAWFAAQQFTLRKYSRIKYRVTFESLLDGWHPGQQFIVTSVNRGDQTSSNTGYSTWDSTFTQRFFVTQVEIRPEGADGTTLSVIQADSDVAGS